MKKSTKVSKMALGYKEMSRKLKSAKSYNELTAEAIAKKIPTISSKTAVARWFREPEKLIRPEFFDLCKILNVDPAEIVNCMK